MNIYYLFELIRLLMLNIYPFTNFILIIITSIDIFLFYFFKKKGDRGNNGLKFH